jgi:hypothetical protein
MVGEGGYGGLVVYFGGRLDRLMGWEVWRVWRRRGSLVEEMESVFGKAAWRRTVYFIKTLGLAVIRLARWMRWPLAWTGIKGGIELVMIRQIGTKAPPPVTTGHATKACPIRQDRGTYKARSELYMQGLGGVNTPTVSYAVIGNCNVGRPRLPPETTDVNERDSIELKLNSQAPCSRRVAEKEEVDLGIELGIQGNGGMTPGSLKASSLYLSMNDRYKMQTMCLSLLRAFMSKLRSSLQKSDWGIRREKNHLARRLSRRS